MNAEQKAQRAIEGARNQWQTMFRNMAASMAPWHFYAGSAGYVLLEEGASMDAPLELAVPNAHAHAWPRLASQLHDDSRRRAFT